MRYFVLSSAVAVLALAQGPLEGQSPATASKVVAFAIADQNGGLHPGKPGWVGDWIRKNEGKYPNVEFRQGDPVQGAEDYLIVLSNSERALSGSDAVRRTTVSTAATPVSGTGTVMDNRGNTWNYTFTGTADTTATTTSRENVPFVIESNTVYATAYDLNGVIVTQRSHTYSRKHGGDSSNTIGYNLGNALRSINSRSRLLDSVVKDLVGRK